jgi:flagellar biosynthesis/type III secretory pathway protein FliH
MAHPDLETAEAAEAGLVRLPEDRQRLYWDVIMSVLPELVRQAVEARMIKGYEYQSEFARRYYSQGLQEGREEGREEGLRRASLALVDARVPSLRGELERRLAGLSEARLEQLVIGLGQARDEDRVRAVLDRI